MGGKSCLADAGVAGEQESARRYRISPPALDLGDNPFAAGEALGTLGDIGGEIQLGPSHQHLLGSGGSEGRHDRLDGILVPTLTSPRTRSPSRRTSSSRKASERTASSSVNNRESS